MTDNLFALLMNFFEKSLSQLTKEQEAEYSDSKFQLSGDSGINFLHLKKANPQSMRIIIPEERVKLTKVSYQFLMQMLHLNIISTESMESILNELLSSQSYVTTLEELKWAIRNQLADSLDEAGHAFLELVLYPNDEKLTQH